ncbi:hypothetical protein JL100_035465 (plasmid) [Skermanella mucosa]|uniref:hypothetical protein n=1 Tax=Skermanella mucosa TaxID=1789672 RepID=UPI00192C41D0|nr:hypothetical protein [Skermanella mucosa]UEM25355.1 hypothetical protein JL100_035465 [Skermanella mucosa]
MKLAKTLALVWLMLAAAPAGARSEPFLGAAIVGTPVIGLRYENVPTDFLVSSEHIFEPTVSSSATGGGSASGSLFGSEGVSTGEFLTGLAGSASLDLDGRGAAQVSLAGRVRTTATVTAPAPGEPPFFTSSITVGPNTFIELQELEDVRYSLFYNFSVVLPSGEGDIELFNRTNRAECVQTGETRCSTFFDSGSGPFPLIPSPERPVVFDTVLRYTATLESLAVPVDEPAPASLMITALALLGISGRVCRRIARQLPGYPRIPAMTRT